MDLSNLIFGALQANPDIVTPHAVSYANNASANSFTIDEIISPPTLEILKSEMKDIPVIYTAKKPVNGGDHPAAAAMRSVIRQMADRATSAFSSSSFLHVGATFREFQKYKDDKNHHFAVHGSEAKDEGRNALFVNLLKERLYMAFTRAEMLAGHAARDTQMSEAARLNKSALAEWQFKGGEKLARGEMLTDEYYRVEKQLKERMDQHREQVRKFKRHVQAQQKSLGGGGAGGKTDFGKNTTAKKFMERVKSFEIGDLSDMEVFTKAFDDVMGLNGRLFSTSAFYTGHAMRSNSGLSFDVLLLEDVGYDFSDIDWLEYFFQTNASTAFVTGIFPLELLHDHLVPSRAYTFENLIGGNARLSFPNAFSHSYQHDKNNWARIISKPFIRGGMAYDFDIHMETKSRVGPYALIEMHKVPKGLVQSYISEVPHHRRTVSVLRPSSLQYTTLKGKKVVDYTRAKRFDFPEDQFDKLISFFLTLDIKSQSLTNMLSYTRRAFEGISLVKGVEAMRWADFDQDLIPDLCGAALMHCVVQLRDQLAVIENFESGEKILESRMAPIPGFVRSLFGPFALAAEYLFTPVSAERLYDFLVIRRSWRRDLSDLTPSLPYRFGYTPKAIRSIFLDADMFSEAATPCPVCKTLSGKLGKQKVCCQFRVKSSYDVSFSEDECLRLKVDLLGQSNTASGGLFEALTEAAKSMLIADHQQQVRVEYIRGGPGVGKSYLIRALYPGMDIATIAVPLIELLVDYPRTEVKTPHKFMKAGSKKILFVDEFSIFDGRILRYMIARYKVDIVYVVGDTAQNRILPEHGEYIGSIFDLDSVSRHSLHVNFRTDSRYIVSRLNKEVPDYNMITSASIDRLPIIKDIGELANDPTPDGDVMTIRFSDNAEEFCPGAKSVSSVQGKTCEVARLILSKYDKALSSASGQFVVSISRQKKDLVIYADIKETKDWDFWKKLGYHAAEALENDGSAVRYTMEPTPLALAYMDEPQMVPNNVELSEDLRQVRKVWSQAVCGDIVDRLPNDFVAENYHYIRSFVTDDEIGCSLDDCLLSIDSATDTKTVFEKLKPFGITASDDSPENYKYIYDLSNDSWTTHENYILRGYEDINYDDENFFGQTIPKCFLRALRALGAKRSTLFAASKLCNISPEGVSLERATTFMLEHADEHISLWYTEGKYTHSAINTPACTRALELENGHWQPKKTRKVMLVGGSERHLKDDISAIKHALKVGAKVSSAAISLLAKTPLYYEKMATLTDALLAKPKTGAGRVLKAAYDISVVQTAILAKNLYDSVASAVVQPNANVLDFDFDTNRFTLLLAAGQGLTVDIIENFPQKAFSVEAEIRRLHLPTIAIYDRPLVVTHQMSLQHNISVEELGQVPSDSYLNGKEHLPISYETKSFSTLNERAASFFSTMSATNGRLNPNILAPPMKKNRIRQEEAPKMAVSIGEGLHYSAANQAQTIATVVKRYLQSSRYTPSVTGRLKAKQVARKAAAMVLQPGVRLDEDTQEAIFRRHAMDARKRNYEGRMLASGEHAESRVDFSMKDIFKPFKDKINLDKVGQGISASSPFVNFAFGGGFRVMTACLQYALKENVVLDNGYTEMEFADIVSEQLSTLPGRPDTCVLDVEAMDSTQNWFTMEMEKEFWKILGIDPTFVDEYFKYRVNYPIFYKDILQAVIESAKGSGMPDTLVGNSLIIMIMSCWGVKRTGRFFMIVKGDDAAIWGYKLGYDADAMLELKPYTKFKFSIDINVPMEFCGNAIEGKFICPDLYRTLRKITGNRFRDYAHWTQYQQSLRDRITLIWTLGISKVVQINAARCNVSEARMYDVLYTIISYSHINREQWEEHFTPVRYPDPYRRM